MRVVIHGGLHRTGTTSFQWAMRHFAPMCLAHRIFYPMTAAGPGHHEWAQRAQEQRFDFVSGLVEEARRAVGADGVILLSSEDFESLIVQPSTAKALESQLSAAGCQSVSWGFVVRDQYEYLLSLYAEMSKHGVLFELGAMAETIIRFGHVRCSNGTTQWAFVFDYESAFRRFRALVAGEVSVFDMAGEPLFPASSVLGLAGLPVHRVHEIAAALDSVVPPQMRNARLAPEQVERHYARSFLARSGVTGDDAPDAELLADAVRIRVAAFESARTAVRSAMQSRFGTA